MIDSLRFGGLGLTALDEMAHDQQVADWQRGGKEED